MMADRVLARLSQDFPGIKIDRIDILKHPGQAWKNGVRMVPALTYGKRILSGIVLGKNEIRRFLEEISQTEKPLSARGQNNETSE